MMDTSASSANDFDFIIGDWRVLHRRLKQRLVGCTDWIEFEGTSTTRKIMGGFGNLEDNVLEPPDGAYRALAMRSFDPATARWAIWWLDGRRPHQLDVPVVGRFDDGIGVFLAHDILDGKPITVRFTWTHLEDDTARWEQAFSDAGGNPWETNWTMDFTRIPV
jgi:hypothetical protein